MNGLPLDEFKAANCAVVLFEEIERELIRLDGEKKPIHPIEKIKRQGMKKELLAERARIAEGLRGIVDLRA